MWMVMALGCGSELLSISVQQSSDVLIPGLAEAPEDAQGYTAGDLDSRELEDLDLGGWLDEFDQDLLRSQGIDPDDVSGISLVGLTIEIVHSPDVDLSFLDELTLWVSADGVPERKIAGQKQFSDGVTTVEMVSEPVDLAPYALATGMAIRTVVDGLPPEADATLRATVELEVGLTADAVMSQLRQL